MLPSSCLDGSITPVGPGQNPQYTGAVQRREAVGCSQGLKNEPTKQHGSGVENQHGSGASVAVPQPARQPASSAQCVNKAMISSRSSSTQYHRVSGNTTSAGKHRVSRSTVEVQAGVQQEHDGRRHRDPDKRDAARAEQSRLELRSRVSGQ